MLSNVEFVDYDEMQSYDVHPNSAVQITYSKSVGAPSRKFCLSKRPHTHGKKVEKGNSFHTGSKQDLNSS